MISINGSVSAQFVFQFLLIYGKHIVYLPRDVYYLKFRINQAKYLKNSPI